MAKRPKFVPPGAPLLIEKVTEHQEAGGTVWHCQLFQGPKCVASSTSTKSSETALKNAYRSYKKQLKESF